MSKSGDRGCCLPHLPEPETRPAPDGMAKPIPASAPLVLTINCGSSSIKFGLYWRGDAPLLELSGKIDRIGLPGTSLSFRDRSGGLQGIRPISGRDHAESGQTLCDWLVQRAGAGSITAIGHRIVHGGAKLHEPQRITGAVLDELHRISDFAPEHLPAGIAMIELFGAKLPDIPQVACFDTAFHRAMPRVAKMLPIPRRFQAAGIERYGFHGLSYTYLMEELARLAGEKAARGRLVLAHLGNGASLAAVRDGGSIDTTMGFTPTAGLPMSTRSGDLDPGLVSYFSRSENMTAEQFQRMVNHESGLLGISETSPDLRDLLAAESARPPRRRSGRAVLLPGPQGRRGLCRCARRPGHAGLHGRHRRERRRDPLARYAKASSFLGIRLDEARNAAGEAGHLRREESGLRARHSLPMKT